MIISVFPYIENESVRRLTGDVLSELDRLKCHVYVTKECTGQNIEICEPRRLEAGKGHAGLSHHFSRQNLYGCGSVHRWVYGLYAAKRRKAGVFR